jgi:inosose dehydratase
MNPNRRQFINSIAGASAATLLTSAQQATLPPVYPISCNSYNWHTFYGRQGKKWGENWDACIADFAKTGIPAFEPGLDTLADAQRLIPALQKYNIKMPSVYVNSMLHKQEDADKTIAGVLAIADEVRKYGTKIMVTNPTPIKWGSEVVKSDAELAIQLRNLDLLGSELRKKGLTLAYHTHDVELKAGAREFHHMLLNTSPQNVSFCYDVHWVYRGSQDSQIAVFDVLKMYGKRIVELHIRQSEGGVFSETFGATGDIDYTRLVAELKKMNIRPHLVIEQCIETKSPNTLDPVTAHIKDLAAIQEVFKPLMS